ncbi:MAG: UDP-N-acetylglucosamine pyrophosphorylase [Clostridia bacterium]|nr:UDP-N-acetylglucosamine pyrophosphorylase [Clostridia bacterium]
MIPAISEYIKTLLSDGLEGFTKHADGVYVGENVTIAPTATIHGPTIIGNNTEIRPGAYIRGNVIIGDNCVIGNSTEIKNSILLDKVQVPHYNYIGDSILGNRAHMGAGAVCSNLKADGSNVVVRGDVLYRTGLRKLGGILGDGADIGCGCVLNPGTVIGKNTSVYPMTALRGVLPDNSIVKSMKNIVSRLPKK